MPVDMPPNYCTIGLRGGLLMHQQTRLLEASLHQHPIRQDRSRVTPDYRKVVAIRDGRISVPELGNRIGLMEKREPGMPVASRKNCS